MAAASVRALTCSASCRTSPSSGRATPAPCTIISLSTSSPLPRLRRPMVRSFTSPAAQPAIIGRRSMDVRCMAGFGKKAPPKPASKVCPCGGGDDAKNYEDCCGPYHTGATDPPDALALMKSRYSAYAKGLKDYVISTTHPDFSRTDDKSSDLEVDTQWMLDTFTYEGLEILSYEPGGETEEGDTEWVAFCAKVGRIGEKSGSKKARGKARLEEMNERSRFVKLDGRWLYRAIDDDGLSTRLAKAADDKAKAQMNRVQGLRK
eukprot:CAMPEP_0182896328 /NCGR_PEP_ID=MMETSP0034_2-20130328/26209_1 /TAXON_ID=156128 /ORGANISM="Nephroselmis pyriformis, Strain CCMP717" /LENGTH=261 /DNA_ID=CAMNT_0025030189 /DNA_START=15 /DNA_END=797 /DNA_ORIENTATION=+